MRLLLRVLFYWDVRHTDEEGVMRMYGWVDEDALNDPIGAVDCEEGRVVVFPNVLQHGL